jgi:hypothetical protein
MGHHEKSEDGQPSSAFPSTADIATGGTPITPMAAFRENDDGIRCLGFEGGGTARQCDTIYSPAERIQPVSRAPNPARIN